VIDRSYRSIGEVLAEVQDEFPDVTISKIRFLESQGLIDPERTPSGYRKFYDHDVERLRTILRTQREAYLPLKVIRDRLERGDEMAQANGSVPTLTDSFDTQRETVDLSSGDQQPVGDPSVAVRFDATTSAIPVPRPILHAAAPPAPRAIVPQTAAGPNPVPERPVPERPVPERPAVGSLPPTTTERPSGALLGDDDTITAEQLAARLGIDEATLGSMESFGLLRGQVIGRTTYFDADAVDVAHAVAGLLALGLESRHLRMYRTAVDREADLFEQTVLPLLKQRNPQARDRAHERLTALADAGEALRQALMTQALRPHLGPTTSNR
jgi:DNA-binding transcriptional MerR regulator